jgi:Zn-dependent protease
MSRIRIRFSFLCFNAVLFCLCDGRMIVSFYTVCLLHELGHIAALRLTGGELRAVELSCFGIRMTAAPAADVKRGAAVLLSGPAANLLLYALLTVTGKCPETASLSLAAGLFNLLPLSSLDGGALLDMLAEGSVCERQIQLALKALRIAAAAALLLLIGAEMAKT